eukprot:4890233-Pyramimonas_sp.AAC.1
MRRLRRHDQGEALFPVRMPGRYQFLCRVMLDALFAGDAGGGARAFLSAVCDGVRFQVVFVPASWRAPAVRQ